MVALRKGFVTVPHGQVHYRYGGRGPVLVMLHDSPRSSVRHVPSIEWLGEHFTVIALDTPGYGNSSPLPVGQREIADYSTALETALTALGVERCATYGNHTGAKIALQFAADHPERAALTLLDGLALPSAPPAPAFLDAYLRMFEPEADGSHLTREWTRLLDMHRYFPWFDRKAGARLAIELPDDMELHEYATDLLAAGPHWPDAYGAALRHDALPAIARLRSPAIFLYREDDVLFPSHERLPQPLPAGCRFERIPAGANAWRSCLLRELRAARLPASGWAPPAGPDASSAAETQRYVDLVHGQLRVRQWGDPKRGTPLLLLHDVPGGSTSVRELGAALATDRPVIAPDLPGLGESGALPYPTLGSYVGALAEMLETVGAQHVDVVAEGLGTGFAVALAAHRPKHVRRLVLDGMPLIRSRDRRRVARQYCPAVTPDRHGTHVVSLWHQLRDAEISWPWFDRSARAARRGDPALEPRHLQVRLVEMLRQLPSYGDAARAVLEASLRDILRGVHQPTLLLDVAGDVRYAASSRIARRLPSARIAARPESVTARAACLRDFLEAAPAGQPPKSGRSSR